MGVEEQVSGLGRLDQSQVDGKEVGEEKGKVVDELLIFVAGAFVRCSDIYFPAIMCRQLGNRNDYRWTGGQTYRCRWG